MDNVKNPLSLTKTRSQIICKGRSDYQLVSLNLTEALLTCRSNAPTI